MPEIFAAEEQKDIHEIVELENNGRFKNSLGSLVVKPPRTRFESQDEDEEIVIMGRRHFITNLKWLALASFAIFVPMFWGEFPMIKALDANTIFALNIVWYTGLFLYVIQSFLLWFYNVYIVTNERLVDVDFFGLLYKNINVTQINKLEDVNYSQRGIFAGFFNYGDVVVQTSSEQRSDDRSEKSAFTFDRVANPDLVVKIISELMEKDHEGDHK
jgi:hypothetical protein